MVSTVGRFIYTKYWGILYVENCEKIYLHKILRNSECWSQWENILTQNTEEYFMFSTVGRFIYTQYWGILYVQHWEDLFTQTTEEYFMLNTGKIYLHKILRNTVFWTLWEDLFTQNTEEYCMLRTVGRFIYTKYWGIYCMLNTVGRFIYTKYWGILYVEYCGKMYLHKILRNTLCWTLGRFIYTNTRDYVMLSTGGRFIYTKYWWLP